MLKMIAVAAAIGTLAAGAAFAAEPIEGRWKTASGATAQIAPCGSAFCVTLKDGKHEGKQIGRMNGSAGRYEGEITDPENDKTYNGSGTLTGDSLKMRGCVLKVLCRSQTWTRL